MLGPEKLETRVGPSIRPAFGLRRSVCRTLTRGLNDSGDVAFFYALANGTNGVAVAVVPEPSTLFAVIIGGMIPLTRKAFHDRRARRRDPTIESSETNG